MSTRPPALFLALALAAFALAAPPAPAAAPEREVVLNPHLVVIVRTTDPESCHWYYDAYPALVSAGWRIQVYRVPSIPQLGDTSGPMFSLKGDIWHGYRDRASHFRRLADATARKPAAGESP